MKTTIFGAIFMIIALLVGINVLVGLFIEGNGLLTNKRIVGEKAANIFTGIFSVFLGIIASVVLYYIAYYLIMLESPHLIYKG